MEQECKTAILEYAPLERQTNAALFGEYTEYVTIAIKLHRDWYHHLVDSGATEWTDLPPEQIQWLNENKPY